MKLKGTNSIQRIAIGTSGLTLRQTKDQYPPAFKDFTRLQYYSTIFNSIEINSTFYKLHRPATIAKWSLEVATNFRFTFKLWKEITHKKYLDYEKSDLLKFMSALSTDRHKQGCILVQFPASIDASYTEKVEGLVMDISALCTDSDWKIFLEFRHNSWYTKEIFEMLASHHASPVLHDMPKSKLLVAPDQSNIVYLRFHGLNGKYRGSYDDEQIDDYAHQISEWSYAGKEVYVYFNNTMGSAYENAFRLRQKVNALTIPAKHARRKNNSFKKNSRSTLNRRKSTRL